MLEKGMQKSWKNIKKWTQKGSEINRKPIKKEVHKSMRKKNVKKQKLDISTGPLVP